jgi:6-pyruvoyltetrahydropterin/6-carboxytetrahydropterin synthase
MRITYRHELPMGHRLVNHPGKCRGLHGHNYLITYSVEGEVDPDTGMVMDFSTLKQAVRDTLHVYDHALVLNNKDPLIPSLIHEGNLITLDVQPTAENLALTWRLELAMSLGLEPDDVHITVEETLNCAAEVP